MLSHMRKLGDVTALLSKLGLTDPMLHRIGSVAVLASNIEYWTERAIWRVEGIDPTGMRPSTDGKPISALIKQLEDCGSNVSIPELRTLIETWCRASSPAFRCRNSIFHGVTIRLGNAPWFAKNPSWNNEVRKRSFSDFHADEHTLSLLQAAFGVLFRSIVKIERTTRGEAVDDIVSEFLPALKETRSVVVELEDLAAAVNHEKY